MKKVFCSLAILALVVQSVYATRPFRHVETLSNGKQMIIGPAENRACPSCMGGFVLDGVSGRALSASTADGLGAYGTRSAGVLPSIGEVEIPVIMAEFQDMEFLPSTTPELVERMFNEDGFNDNEYTHVRYLAPAGSVRDYFVQNSDGMFRPHFDIKGKVKVSKNYAYYGENNSSGHDKNVLPLVKEAIQLAVEQGADFSNCEYGSDGIPLVVVLHAGPGEHASSEKGSENYIWAHFLGTQFSDSKSGKVFRGYFVGNEVFPDYDRDIYIQTGEFVVSQKYLAGIGVLVHEMCHALGIPDFYSTKSGATKKTPDYWSVMDYGQYQNGGYTPMMLSAYERSLLGWLDIAELPSDGLTTMEDRGAYIKRNPENDKQYYILEPRSKNTWYYENMFGNGMLIWKITYNASRWQNNTVNSNNDVLGVQVVPADGEWQSNSSRKDWADFRGDLYPGDSANAESQTHTSFDFFDTPVFRIAYKDGGVSFYCGTDGVSAIQKHSDSHLTSYALNPWIYISGGKKFLK